MKPTNKFQRHLVVIDRSLPPITPTQQTSAFKHSLPHTAVRLKSGKITCLDCGNSWKNQAKSEVWQDEVIGGTCPHCKTKLEIIATKQRVFKFEAYFTIITTHKKHQVIRKFQLKGRYKSGTESKRFISEVSRIYMAPNGKYGIIGHSYMGSMSAQFWFGDFGLKHNNTIGMHNFTSEYISPRKHLLPIFKRNGFLGDLHTLTHFDFFQAILTRPRSETLLKAKQIPLFVASAERTYHSLDKIEKYWPSIKICIRQNYIVTDTVSWFDYLELLYHFGKDLNSPKYVCPENFKKEHNKYVQRRSKQIKKIEVAELRRSLIEDQVKYSEEKKHFFGLSFSNGKIDVKVVSTVKHLMELGDYLKHCIFTNSYHKRTDSLLFYATLNDVPLETLELDLNSFKVVQSRGMSNVASEFKNDIIKLVNENIHEIKKVSANQQKSA